VRPGAEKSKSTSSSRDTQLTLREQLVSYYTKRALEVLWMCDATLWNSLLGLCHCAKLDHLESFSVASLTVAAGA
jgi:hypothetical protein